MVSSVVQHCKMAPLASFPVCAGSEGSEMFHKEKAQKDLSWCPLVSCSNACRVVVTLTFKINVKQLVFILK